MRQSVWGSGDKLTLSILKKTRITGQWIDLGAGDGRYLAQLLETADNVLIADKDKNSLRIVLKNLPEKYKNNIKSKVFDMTRKFPLATESFDGIFCTGTLHIFHEKHIRHIFSEMDRILKPKGTMIIDFATDVARKGRLT